LPVHPPTPKRYDRKKLTLAAAHPDLAPFLEEELKVEMLDNNEFLTLTFSYSDPLVATTIVKAVSECYLERTGYGETHGRADKIAELEKAYNKLAEDLSNKRKNHKRLVENLGGESPPHLKQLHEAGQHTP